MGAGGVVWFYLYKAILPVNLAFVYPQWHIEDANPLWWLPLAAALALTASLWIYRTSWSRSLLFAWGFSACAWPVMGFTDVGFMKYSLVADHYQHIAIIAVIALAAAGLAAWHRTRSGPTAWAARLAAWRRWERSPFSRGGKARNFMTSLRFTGRSWKKIRLVGWYITTWLAPKSNRRRQDALEHYEEAVRLKPDYIEAQHNLGIMLTGSGRWQEAIEHLKQALQLNPEDSVAHNHLGIALAETGRPQEAIEHYKKAVQLKPDYFEACNNLGIALAMADRPQEAVDYFRQVLRLKSDYSEAHYNLGNVLFQIGRPEEAIEQYRQALRINPDYADAHANLATILARTDRLQDAAEHYRQAIHLRNDFAVAYYNLAATYARMHESAEALAMAQKALDLARSQGKAAFAEEIEKWLNSYRAGLPGPPSAPQSSTNLAPTP